MLTQDKRGICCDKCAMTVTEKFTYYSLDAKEVTVTNSTMVIAAAVAYSFDICDRCMEEIKSTIIKCYKPSRIIDNKNCPQGICCDLTGIRMNGIFTCYYVCVSIVNVDVKGQPSAKVVDDKYLELWVCSEAFARLKSRALEVQNSKENQEWSAQAVQPK